MTDYTHTQMSAELLGACQDLREEGFGSFAPCRISSSAAAEATVVACGFLYMTARFGVDIERVVWRELINLGCTLEKIVWEWRDRKRLCERLRAHWGRVFDQV